MDIFKTVSHEVFMMYKRLEYDVMAMLEPYQMHMNMENGAMHVMELMVKDLLTWLPNMDVVIHETMNMFTLQEFAHAMSDKYCEKTLMDHIHSMGWHPSPEAEPYLMYWLEDMFGASYTSINGSEVTIPATEMWQNNCREMFHQVALIEMEAHDMIYGNVKMFREEWLLPKVEMFHSILLDQSKLIEYLQGYVAEIEHHREYDWHYEFNCWFYQM